MHRSRGTLPVSGGRRRGHGRGAASAKGRASSGLPATPEAFFLTEGFRAGVHLLPRFTAAAAAPAFLCLCPVPKLIVCTITNELVTQILVARALLRPTKTT